MSLALSGRLPKAAARWPSASLDQTPAQCPVTVWAGAKSERQAKQKAGLVEFGLANHRAIKERRNGA
jgi:hypothetical protein